METTSSTTGSERPSPNMIFVVALLVAVFAAAVMDVVIPINVVDISKTFSVLPGTVAQLDSLIAMTTVATALLLAGIGDWFRNKSLVIIGILFVAMCDIGFFLAPTFLAVQLIVPLNGIGSVLIVVTAQTFVGNSYPLDKKAKAIGYVTAAGTLANAVGAPIIGFMTSIGGWRSTLLWFMLPMAAASLILVLLAFPYSQPELQLNAKKEPFMRGFNQVLSDKSAVACLIAAFLGSAFWLGGAVLEVTFLREVFSVSTGFAASVGPLAGTAFVTVGAVAGGHMVNLVGRKRLTLATTSSAGMFVLLSYFMQNLSIFLVLRWAASALIGASIAAASNLMLEQLPQFRGTIMSLRSAFSGAGTAVGIAVAGAVVNLYAGATIGFQALSLTIGAFAFAGVFVTLFFAREPISPKSES